MTATGGLIQDRSKVEEEIEIASRLLESGASLSTPNRFGLVPLHFAFKLDNVRVPVHKGI